MSLQLADLGAQDNFTLVTIPQCCHGRHVTLAGTTFEKEPKRQSDFAEAAKLPGVAGRRRKYSLYMVGA